MLSAASLPNSVGCKTVRMGSRLGDLIIESHLAGGDIMLAQASLTGTACRCDVGRVQ